MRIPLVDEEDIWNGGTTHFQILVKGFNFRLGQKSLPAQPDGRVDKCNGDFSPTTT
jgi:hypothetical protein